MSCYRKKISWQQFPSLSFDGVISQFKQLQLLVTGDQQQPQCIKNLIYSLVHHLI